MEFVIGTILLVAAYFAGTSKSESEEQEFSPKQCAIMCDSVDSYDHFKQRCNCK